MNEVLACLLERRTIRCYKTEQITEDELKQILQAGLYAANAGSRQSALMMVCQNKGINEELGRFKRSYRHKPVEKREGEAMLGSREQPSIADDPNISSAFYSAPTVITIFSPYWNHNEDAALCAGNMMLAAHSLGIGSCYISRAFDTFESPVGKKLWTECGIDPEYKAVCHVTLGYPDGVKPEPKPRKEGRIVRV
jgi:nitroreductase